MKPAAGMAIAVALLVAGAAHAQGDDPIAHYEAYLDAAEAGDFATASQESEAAWRAAEAAWGEDGDTGLLAFTSAQFRVTIGDRAGAAEPATRAVELAGLSDAYAESEARLLKGVALAISDPATAKGELEMAIAGLDAAGVPPRDNIIRGELDLAMMTLGESPEGAAQMAMDAVQDSRQISSANLRSHLAELGRVQYLAGQYGAASGSLSESINMWEEQEPGVVPAALADTLAWHAIAGYANETQNGPGRFGPFSPSSIPWNFLPDRNCGLRWEEGQEIDFPEVAGETATLGAAVVLYDMADDDTATNVRVIAAAPQAKYNDLIVEQFTGRKAASRVKMNCSIGFVTPVAYQY